MQIGNGLWESAQFNNRLQVTQLGLGTSATDTSQWKLDYDFGTTDNNGNLKAQTVTSPVGTYAQSFTYDSLDRLKTATETSGGNPTWTQAFTYDRYGNRTGFSQTLNGNTTNTTPAIDSNTNRFTLGQGYTYDAAGNVITDPQGRSFTFNGDNKQTEVKDASNNIVGTYSYDGDGKRIKKVTAQENTTFVYSGGKLVAEYQLTNATPQTATTQYLGTDMLGSPRVVSDQTGTVTSRRDFMPFGEDLTRANYGSDAIRQKFTGYEKDTETGLDFAEARYYNSNHGRFTAVDPLQASGKSADPQTFNRYAYSFNNPLIMVDPSGMQAGSALWGDSITRQITEIKNVMLWGVEGDDEAVGREELRRRNKLSEHIGEDGREDGGVNIQNFSGDWVRLYPAQMNRVQVWLWSDQVWENERNGGSYRELTVKETASIIDSGTGIAGVATNAYKDALSGGTNSGFLKNYQNRTNAEVQKGINSINKRIEEHTNLIKDPQKYFKEYNKGDWTKLDPRQQKALVEKKWLSDIKRQTEQRDILQGILDSRK